MVGTGLFGLKERLIRAAQGPEKADLDAAAQGVRTWGWLQHPTAGWGPSATTAEQPSLQLSCPEQPSLQKVGQKLSALHPANPSAPCT